MKIRAKVTPKASENKVIYDKDKDLYRIKVTQAPEKGKANEKVRELLIDYFQVKNSDVELIIGLASPIKVFEVKGEPKERTDDSPNSNLKLDL